jgi:hypothetical protein
MCVVLWSNNRTHSVRAYISKKNYMIVPYLDRDTAIAAVGKAWCEDKGVNGGYTQGCNS